MKKSPNLVIVSFLYLIVSLAPIHFPPVYAKTIVTADNPAIRYTGRIDFSTPDRPRFDWPGITIEACFEGTSCAVRLVGGGEQYTVIIDGVMQPVLKVGSEDSTYQLVEGLPDSIHTLLMTKRFESKHGVTEFSGFVLDDSCSLRELPPRPPYRIEFIGGSSVMGFGSESNSIRCTDVDKVSNCYFSYGPVTARALQAECHILAISGKGVLRTWRSPFISDDSFLHYYARTVKDDPGVLWDFTQWVPHVVVISLGTNDFSTHPHPTKELFINTYVTLLRTIQCTHTHAEIVCLSPSREPLRTYVREMVEGENEEGNSKIHFLSYNKLPYKQRGCDWHPNIEGHKTIAEGLIELIGPLLDSMSVDL